MIDIEVKAEYEPKSAAPVRRRSVFALGWVKFTACAANSDGQPAQDDIHVLGLMVVQDTDAPAKSGAY